MYGTGNNCTFSGTVASKLGLWRAPNNSTFITGQHRLIIVPPVYHSYCSSNLKDFKFAHVLLSGSHFYFSFQESVLNQIPPFTKIPNKTNKCSSEEQADCQKPIRFSDWLNGGCTPDAIRTPRGHKYDMQLRSVVLGAAVTFHHLQSPTLSTAVGLPLGYL